MLSTHGERSLYECAFRKGDALVFGNESSGLPEEMYERYRESLFRIPMPGEHARSINLANSVAIAAYECFRQLRANSGRLPFMNAACPGQTSCRPKASRSSLRINSTRSLFRSAHAFGVPLSPFSNRML